MKLKFLTMSLMGLNQVSSGQSLRELPSVTAGSLFSLPWFTTIRQSLRQSPSFTASDLFSRQSPPVTASSQSSRRSQSFRSCNSSDGSVEDPFIDAELHSVEGPSTEYIVEGVSGVPVPLQNVSSIRNSAEVQDSEIAGNFIKDFMESEDRKSYDVDSYAQNCAVGNSSVSPANAKMEKVGGQSQNEEVKKVCLPSDLVELWQKLWQGICVTVNENKQEQSCEVSAPIKTISSKDDVNLTDTTNTVSSTDTPNTVHPTDTPNTAHPTDTTNSRSINTGANVIVVVKNDKIGFFN